MKDFFYFFSLQDANIRYVALGCMLLGAVSASVGSFAFLRKQALVGDAVAHALLPGICVAFLLVGKKMFAGLLLGAFLSGLLALTCIQYLVRHSKLKQDASIALVLSVFFGCGIFILTSIQQSGNAAQSGLNSFLFGKAAALLSTDMWLFFGLAAIVIVAVWLFFKEFTLLCFDTLYARSLGLPVGVINGLLTVITLLCIVLGIQAVGVVLVAALLITPAAAAHFWTVKLRSFLLLSACFGTAAGLIGAYVSYALPQMPTGPWIVLVLSVIAIVSFLLAPKRGALARWWTLRQARQKMQEENILKTFYQLGEARQDFFTTRTASSLLQRRSSTKQALRAGSGRLVGRSYLRPEVDGWQLSPKGLTAAKQIVRQHRLWELYLSQHLHISTEEVHEKAERIEHVLDKSLVEELDQLLAHPKTDPHQRNIPS